MPPAEYEPNPKPANPKIVDASRVKLGKKVPKKDPRNLKLASYLDMEAVLEALPETPVRSFYGYRVENYWNKLGADPWPMYGNDVFPDCTCAAIGHMEEVYSANAGDPEKPSKASVMELFDATGPRNEGRYCVDILNYWRKTGFGPDREKIFAWTEVDPQDINMCKIASHLFGGLYLGIALPLTAQNDTNRWIYHAGASSSQREPGSWGGHAVNTVAYSEYNTWLITWGEKIQMSWGFWKHYVDEVYVTISPDWFKDGGLSVPGFDRAALETDLAQVSA